MDKAANKEATRFEFIEYKPDSRPPLTREIVCFDKGDCELFVSEWADEMGYLDFSTAVQMLMDFQNELKSINGNK